MSGQDILIPWFQENYDDQVEGWIREELEKASLSIRGKMERVKETDMSLVIRVPTNEDDYYFKVVGSASKQEAMLSRELNITHPGKTVEVLAVNEMRGWLLMRDLKGQSLRTLKDKKIWQKAISEFGELQITELENIERLLQLGVPDRRMSVLKEEIQQRLEEMCATGLNKEQTNQVMTLLPILLEMCDELESIIPASLEHGDLHSNNIRLVENNIVFFDWGDASVSHPFFSTRIFWHALDDLIESESEWLRLVDEFRPYYLEPWTKIAPMRELERALRISDELACVQRALSWHLYITPNRKNKHESYNKPSQWLQLLLEQRALVGK
ncbi:phosphotransferase [Lederbergia citri]|uniref:Phosphotransferase n=1 Tax=Lederbergia citri TaxID=2833580 RepID=A0A942YJ39_9BACI|nr:phosphotransferase [Lederbergia citri]MBS4197689.1 phosphotransferase [Lederbergia citri]